MRKSLLLLLKPFLSLVCALTMFAELSDLQFLGRAFFAQQVWIPFPKAAVRKRRQYMSNCSPLSLNTAPLPSVVSPSRRVLSPLRPDSTFHRHRLLLPPLSLLEQRWLQSAPRRSRLLVVNLKRREGALPRAVSPVSCHVSCGFGFCD